MSREIVYILTNPSMKKHLIKIGHTTQKLKERVRHLSSPSGVPTPFEIYYACIVKDSKKIEKALKSGFRDHLKNPKREFFEIAPDCIRVILELFAIEDVMPNKVLIENSKKQYSLKNKPRKKRRNFTYNYILVSVVAIDVLSYKLATYLYS